MLIGLPPVKYYFSKDKRFYKLIHQLTGLYPSNLQVFKVAFIHKSASKSFDRKRLNNERLEFLGDAILASIVADFLYAYFPFKKEGFLTKMRARIVSRDQLNEIALKMGLQFHIVAQNKINGTKNIYGNALEALIGAVYVDKGYKKTKNYVLKKVIENNIDLYKLAFTDSDYKSQVIEWAQKNKLEINYEDEEVESTEQNSLYFTSVIKLDDHILGRGKGASKKEAQQRASKQALDNTEEFTPVSS